MCLGRSSTPRCSIYPSLCRRAPEKGPSPSLATSALPAAYAAYASVGPQPPPRIWALLRGPAHRDKMGATGRRWGIDPLVGLRVAVYVIRQFLEVGPAAPRGARSEDRKSTRLNS